MRLISSLIFLLISFSVYAQKCALGVMASPELQRRHAVFQQHIENFVANSSNKLRNHEGIIRIPVVIHVIHDNAEGIIGGESNTNISDAQIFSQIKVLNEDFRKAFGTPGYNENPDGADMEIEFFLAPIDPDGNPSSGITRTYNSRRSYDVFSDLEFISGMVRWDVSRYLNIWVVNLSGSYLGYGEFPGGELDGLELTDPPEETDGVFIDYEVFGRQTGTATGRLYGYGRTLTHEVGHWIGLIHTWGDAICGDDYCADTPPTRNENDTETCLPLFSRCNGVRTQNMIENYMDYTPDSCMNVFTNDQKARSRIVFEISDRRRSVMLNSQLLEYQGEVADMKVLSNPGDQNNMALQIFLPDFQDFNLSFYDLMGRLVQQVDYKQYPSTVIRMKDLNLPQGPLVVRFTSNSQVITKRLLIL